MKKNGLSRFSSRAKSCLCLFFSLVVVLILIGFPRPTSALNTTVEFNILTSPTPTPSSIPTPTPAPHVPTPFPTPVPTPSPTPKPDTQTNPGTTNNPGDRPPFIYQAERVDETTIKLFFIVGDEPFTHYQLVYGFQGRNDFSFGVRIDNPRDGFVVISGLFVNATYIFQLIPVNDNAPGPRSNVFPVTLRELEVGQRLFVDPPPQASPVWPYSASPGDDDSSEGPWSGPETGSDYVGDACAVSSPYLFYRGFLPRQKDCCHFSQSWLVWLCWPWWLIIVICFLLFAWWQYSRQERKNQKRSKRARQSSESRSPK